MNFGDIKEPASIAFGNHAGIIQSMLDNVFVYPLGLNWVIVCIYVPALLVSALLIFMQLLSPRAR